MTDGRRGPRVTPWAAALSRSPFRPGAGSSADVMDLAYGYPDPATHPIAELAEASARVLSPGAVARRGLSYGPALGSPDLVDRLRGGLWADVGTEGATLLTNGSMDALDLVVRSLVRPGDVVVVESPTFLGVIPLLRAAGAEVRGVPAGADGIDVALLEHTVVDAEERGRQVRFAYVMPTHANPTASVLPAAERVRLVELATRRRFLLVEDDAYRELGFGPTAAPPTLHALAPHCTLHLRTLSKVLGPGLRMGGVTGPAELVDVLAAVRPPGGTSPLVAELLVDVLDEVDLKAHLRSLVTRYRRRRDLFTEALDEALPEGAERSPSRGGFFAWVRLPRGVRSDVLAVEAARAGVAYLPGEPFQVEPARPAVRLSFSCLEEGSLSEAAQRFGEALRAATPSVVAR